MKVRIGPDAMAASETFRDLDRILDSLFQERHRWDEQDPASVEGSAWGGDSGRAGQRVLEAAQKLLGDQLYEGRDAARATSLHTLTLTITLATNPPVSLSPADAVKALEMPAFVIVENGESDRAFLEAMLRAFGRDALNDALDRGLWEIVSAGGGGEIPKRVSERVARIGAGPRRVLILSDSDRLTPGEHTKTVEQITACSVEHGVTAIILNKREIENYLPHDALWDKSGKRDVCAPLLRLTPGQRDHYDMKKGFRVDKKTRTPLIPAAQLTLFSGVRPRKLLHDLIGGFGDKVWRSFASGRIDELAMREICLDDEDEIPRLLDAIERLV
jgi:hypothetical protein